jgi:hypothetical protein
MINKTSVNILLNYATGKIKNYIECRGEWQINKKVKKMARGNMQIGHCEK